MELGEPQASCSWFQGPTMERGGEEKMKGRWKERGRERKEREGPATLMQIHGSAPVAHHLGCSQPSAAPIGASLSVQEIPLGLRTSNANKILKV